MQRKPLLLLLSTFSLIIPALADSLQPSTITLGPLQQKQFTLTGNDPNVSWGVTPAAVGTITSTGLYTAPAAGSSRIVFVYAHPQASSQIYYSVIFLSPTPVTLAGNPAPQPTQPAPPPVQSNISVSVFPASKTLQAGQSLQFNASVQGTSNQQVQWSLNPNMGTIANGYYTAPSSFSGNDVQVTISASSMVNTNKLGTATVLLSKPVTLQPPDPPNISVSVGPGSAKLSAGGSTQFTALVQGTTNTAVTWSFQPSVGTLVNGLYTAPVSISTLQTIVVTATSQADPAESATASVTLQPNVPPPTVSVSVLPGSVSLTGGQSATFTPTVSGSSDTAVTWSINPAVGTINGGVYQAPSVIGSQQTVTVTATSAADSTKSSSATVTLVPVGITLGSTFASLGAGNSATFTATVTGSSNQAVTWSMNPLVGSLVNGVYTAPATISAAQTVTVIATSVADSTKTARATVNLTPSNASGPSGVTLPLEVLGANGTTASALVNIPVGSNLNGQLSLWMQIHGLRTETQASVQVNNSAWMPISDSTVTLQGNAKAYGGIGGGFSTLKMTMNLPAGVVQTGANTITFRFNQTDGRVSGFRVLAFNIQAAGGSSLIPASTFGNDDPSTWQPPSSNPSDIATGQTLWHQANLITPLATGGSKPIRAHCSDCHAQDGRDLKYFNYSNNSIEARSVFHGLTPQQGAQIASYIRSLNVANPGRPWNPPYQPGPGLDEQPTINWSAGAGIDAVLDTDQEMLNAIFPSGIQPSVFAATSRLNQRELPLPAQLPDWNQWLPGTHPMDAFGATFTSSGYNTVYQTLSSSLQVLDPTVYAAQQQNFGAWFSAFYSFYNQVGTPIWTNPATMWTPANVDAMYSVAQWGLVKTWELNNQFQLEGMTQAVFGPQGEARAWNSSLPFFVSPHELKMPSSGVTGLRNGSQADYIYLSYIWYNLQLILNDSNGHQQDHFPIDWGYANNSVEGMGVLVPPQGGIQTMWMIKGLQILQATGTGPQLGMEGWQPNVTQLSTLVTPEWNLYVWTGEDPSTRATIATNIVQSWLQQASQFTPQQFYTGGWTTATATPVPGGNPYDSVWVDQFWYMIPRFNFIGVDPTLLSQLAQFAQKMWPKANWTADLNATCAWSVDLPNNPPNFLIKCSQ